MAGQTKNLVIYAHADDQGSTTDLLKKLGKHKGSLDTCLYINKLADVNLAVLEDVVKPGVTSLKKKAAEKKWPVSAS